MTKPQLVEALKELGIEADVSLSKPELEAKLAEAQAAAGVPNAGVEPVAEKKQAEEPQSAPLFVSKAGKFSLFEVGNGWIVKNDMGQLISSGKDMSEGAKLLADLSR